LQHTHTHTHTLTNSSPLLEYCHRYWKFRGWDLPSHLRYPTWMATFYSLSEEEQKIFKEDPQHVYDLQIIIEKVMVGSHLRIYDGDSYRERCLEENDVGSSLQELIKVR
jgi:hypothetical protein